MGMSFVKALPREAVGWLMYPLGRGPVPVHLSAVLGPAALQAAKEAADSSGRVLGGLQASSFLATTSTIAAVLSVLQVGTFLCTIHGDRNVYCTATPSGFLLLLFYQPRPKNAVSSFDRTPSCRLSPPLHTYMAFTQRCMHVWLQAPIVGAFCDHTPYRKDVWLWGTCTLAVLLLLQCAVSPRTLGAFVVLLPLFSVTGDLVQVPFLAYLPELFRDGVGGYIGVRWVPGMHAVRSV